MTKVLHWTAVVLFCSMGWLLTTVFLGLSWLALRQVFA